MVSLLVGLTALALVLFIPTVAILWAVIEGSRCQHDWRYEEGPPEVIRCVRCGEVEAW